METVRQIIRRRDSASDTTITEMFECLSGAIADGDDPEDAFAEEFGLEPDYLLEDKEAYRAVSKGFRARSE